MKKYHILTILLFCSVLIHSQERYYLNSDTRLYTAATTSGAFSGYFKYGAEVQLLSESNNGWYKVKADNLSEGYVPAKFIAQRLNAKDAKVKDPENPIIEGGDAYYGSSHLFVLAASLKARALPDKNSKIREILNTGDPVSVNYLPKNPEEWVNLHGTFIAEYVKSAQRKYLGKRPDFEALLKEFDKLDVNAISDRKNAAERIVELAWNSDPSKLTPAYQRYYAVVKQLNDPKLIAETELNVVLAKAMAKRKTPEEVAVFTKNAIFSLKGLKTKSFNISQKDLVKTFGKPPKKKTVTDECGIYISETFYCYPDLEISVDETQNLAEVVKVYSNANNKLIINSNSVLDNSISEKAFIEKYGAYITASIKTPHYYSINIGDGQFELEFRDGKLFAIEIMFFC